MAAAVYIILVRKRKRTPDQTAGKKKGVIQMQRVRNFYHKNQFVIIGEGKITFQSYDSTIAEINADGKLRFFNDWDYSQTTLKHLYLFLNDYKHELDAETYKNIFSKGFEYSKNKKAFLQKLIDEKIVKHYIIF